MQRPALSVLLALALVLAGCSGAQAPGTTTEHRTTTATTQPTADASTTTTAAATPTRTTAERLAPGVTRAGVVNASALVGAHVSSLNTSGYEHRVRVATEMETEANETFTSEQTRRARATPGWGEYRLRRVQVEADDDARQRSVSTEWSNSTVLLLRTEAGNRTDYQRLDDVGLGGSAEREMRLTSRLVLRDFLRWGDYRVADRNGSAVTLVADGASAENVTAFSATAAVDADGRIHRLNATMTAAMTGDRTMTMRVQYRLVRLGVEHVEQPPWADEALREGNESA